MKIKKRPEKNHMKCTRCKKEVLVLYVVYIDPFNKKKGYTDQLCYNCINKE